MHIQTCTQTYTHININTKYTNIYKHKDTNKHRHEFKYLPTLKFINICTNTKIYK